jgi:hypothetical protein
MSDTMSLRKQVKAAFDRVTPSRPKYKALFEEMRSARDDEKSRRVAAETELGRLRKILADHAKTETIPEMEALIRLHPKTTEIPLYPLSFEAYKASLHSLKRYIEDEDFVPSGIECLFFKNCRVVSKP